MLLKNIIKPFYKLMNRLDYASKFGVVMFLFAAPLFVVLLQLFIASNTQLKQARLHSEGMAAMLQSQALLTQLEKWRDITVLNFVTTDSEFSHRQQLALDEAQQTLSRVKRFLHDKSSPPILHYLDKLSSELDNPSIAPGMEGITIELVYDNVHRYVEEAYDWQRQLATSYGLLGIPDGRSFRAMNIFLYDAGDTYEAFGRARVFGTFFLHTGFIDSSGTYVIDKTYSKLEKEAESIGSKLQSIIAMDALSTQTSDIYLSPIYGVMELMDEQLIQVTAIQAPWRDYFESAGALRDTIREMEQGALYKIKSMLTLAKREREQDMLLLQVSTLVLITLTALLYTGFYYSVKKTITHLVDSAEAVAGGDLDRTMHTQTRDELSLLGRALDHMREQLKARQAHLHQISITDGLTGLYNRTYFDQVLRNETHRALRGKHPLALILIDIDHFKSINDNYGHQAGDACIQFVAEQLKKVAKRASDTAARYGGEEFAIILPESSIDDCFDIAEALRKVIQQSTVEYNEHTITLTVSCGVTSVLPDSTDQINDLIRTADEALYQAKRSGRNCTRHKPIEQVKDENSA